MALDIPRLDGRFEVVSDYKPAGDQPAAIDELERRVRAGDRHTVLLGATGTGKSATTFGCGITEFGEDGLIHRAGNYWNAAALMQQLGVLPATAGATA